MNKNISTDILRGHTNTIIFNVLRQGDSYGYEIYKKIIELSEQQYELKEATLYSAFRRLEKEGMIASYWGDETHGGRRKYYHITDDGIREYKQSITDWKVSNRILNDLIEGRFIEDAKATS